MNLLGKVSEDAGAEFLKTKGWRILQRNLKSPFAEIDIVAERESRDGDPEISGELGIFEVKTCSHLEFKRFRLSYRQRLRLQRAQEWLSESFDRPVSLYLIIIAGGSHVEIFNWDQLL